MLDRPSRHPATAHRWPIWSPGIVPASRCGCVTLQTRPVRKSTTVIPACPAVDPTLLVICSPGRDAAFQRISLAGSPQNTKTGRNDNADGPHSNAIFAAVVAGSPSCTKRSETSSLRMVPQRMQVRGDIIRKTAMRWGSTRAAISTMRPFCKLSGPVPARPDGPAAPDRPCASAASDTSTPSSAAFSAPSSPARWHIAHTRPGCPWTVPAPCRSRNQRRVVLAGQHMEAASRRARLFDHVAQGDEGAGALGHLEGLAVLESLTSWISLMSAARAHPTAPRRPRSCV